MKSLHSLLPPTLASRVSHRNFVERYVLLRRLRPRTAPGLQSPSPNEGRSGEWSPFVICATELLPWVISGLEAEGSEVSKTQPCCLCGSWFNGERPKKKKKKFNSGKSGIAEVECCWVVTGRCKSGETSWRRWCLRTYGINQVKGIPHNRSNLNRGLQAGDSSVRDPRSFSVVSS